MGATIDQAARTFRDGDPFVMIVAGGADTVGRSCTTNPSTAVVSPANHASQYASTTQVLLGIFVYAFFRFTWSMRQYTFGALLVAAAPEASRFLEEGISREAFADKAGRIVGMAAETFNDGLRAYYFSFAVMGWFFSPLVFIAATVGVVWILYQREFRSDVLGVLNS